MIRQLFADLLRGHPQAPASPAPALQDGFNRLVRTRYGLMLYNMNDQYIGRALQVYGEYSELEARLMARLIAPGQTVVDAGANIGGLTVFFAQAVGPAGAVHAFEPQRVIFQTLCANLALNSLTHVHALHAALGAAPGTTTVDKADYARENNFGGMPLGQWPEGERVAVVTLDQLELKACDLIKADVEGMELELLRGAEATIGRFRPFLYLENDREETVASLIARVKELGYRPYWHFPAYFNPDNFLGNPENIFSNLASRNMLCVPGKKSLDVGKLQPAG